MVGQAFIGFEVPVAGIWVVTDLAIEEEEVGSAFMEIGMNVVLLGDGCKLAVIKEPDGGRGFADVAYIGPTSAAASIDMFVETVVEKVVAIASSGVGGTNPRGGDGLDGLVGPPGGIGVGGKEKNLWKFDIPAFVLGEPVRAPIFGQAVLIVGSINGGGSAPFPEIVETTQIASRSADFGHRGQGDGGEHGDEGENDQHFEHGKPVGTRMGSGYNSSSHL